MEWIAHIDEAGNTQSVEEHSRQTAVLSESSSVEELKQICYWIGLLHDIGKFSKEFQKHIRGANIKFEHSLCGAKEAGELIGPKYSGAALNLMQLCIIGHHSGIPDSGGKTDLPEMPTLHGRLKREITGYDAYKSELEIPPLDTTGFDTYLKAGCSNADELVEKYAFLVRYCFSCLTDADSIDTAKAMGEADRIRMVSDFEECAEKLERIRSGFTAVTPLQKARAGLQDQALNSIDDTAEIYLMNMPTGSGKTIAGIRCALKIAREQGLKRIIYVIPYNSIIDQTVDTFTRVFGDSAQILRHQSSFSYDDAGDLSDEDKLIARQNCENWDAQIIVTTAVQFFESLYANKRRRLRKVHNMAESVLVFDEVHMLPREYLQPCLRSISFLTKFMGSRAIFLTATMPDYGKLIHEFSLQSSHVKEMITDRTTFEYFAKCRYNYMGAISDEALIEKASDSPASLIVVNSKKSARTLYDLAHGNKYCLSTYMTGMDRASTISRIKQELEELYARYGDLSKVPEEERILVVSTSLIEAGVDLDFVSVFRELNGLDSILQTGGRCNREGKRSIGEVGIFERAQGRQLKIPTQEYTRGIISDFEDISCTDAIEAYYQRLFYSDQVQKEIVSKSLREQCDCTRAAAIPFAEYSEKFKLIDDENSRSVVVCTDEISREIYENARFSKLVSQRRIQSYSCTVSNYDFIQLLEQGVIEIIDSVPFLTNPDYYSSETGIQFQGKDIFI